MQAGRLLYTFKYSGNTYKARLMLGLLGLDYTAVEVDLRAGEHRRPPFLALNPLGQVPVLVDADVTIADSQAILTYLARRYAAADWLPQAPWPMAQVAYWLSIAANEIQHGPASLRLCVKFAAKLDAGLALKRSHTILNHLDTHLRSKPWLVGDGPTIADVACYPYIALCPEGSIKLQPYPSLSLWLARVEALPGFVAMYAASASA